MAAEMALFARCQPAGAGCPKVFPLRGPPKSPKRTAPRDYLCLRSAHCPQMSRKKMFFRFSPSVLELFLCLWAQFCSDRSRRSRSVCVAWPWNRLHTRLPQPIPLASAPPGLQRKRPGAGNKSRIVWVQQLWDSTWHHSAQTDTSLHKM